MMVGRGLKNAETNRRKAVESAITLLDEYPGKAPVSLRYLSSKTFSAISNAAGGSTLAWARRGKLFH
jgi:hypothetical protein